MSIEPIYEHTDIPPGMTCDEYRRMVRRPKPRRLRRRALVRRLILGSVRRAA
jgi:hypothetical protein